MPIDQLTAKGLLDEGLISQDAFQAAFAQDPKPKTDPTAFRTEEEQAPIEAGKGMLAKQKKAAAVASIKKVEREADEADQAETDNILDTERKRNLARQFGYDEELIAERIPVSDVATADLNSAMPEPTPELVADINRETAEDFPTTAPQPEFSTPGLDLQQQAIAQGAAIGAARGAEESAYYKNLADNMAKEREALTAFQEDRSTKIQEKEMELEDEINRVGEMSIDQGRFWGNKTTADKIGMGISLVLGAFGTGSENRAAKVINDAIQRDINVQAKEIATQKSLISDRRGILKDMKATFKNDVLAKEAAISSYLQKAKIKVQEISSRYAGPEARAKATALIGKLEQQKQASKQRFMKEYMKTLPVNANSNPELLPPDQRERFIPGYGLALTKSSAKLMNEEVIPNYSKLESNLNDLIRMVENSSTLSPSDRGRAETLQQLVVGQLREPVLGPGIMDIHERARLEAMVPKPTDMFQLNSTALTRLKTIKAKMGAGFKKRLKSIGVTSNSDKLGFKPVGD